MVDVFLPLKLNFHKNCCISCFNKELKTNKNNWATIIPFISFYYTGIYVVVNFLSQVIFLFLLFLGMLMYANEV